MGNALQSLETQYFFLTQSLPSLLGACTNQDQKDAVNSQYVTARRNYWSGINAIFHDDDPQVEKLVTEMHAEQDELENAVKKLTEIAKVIAVITTAVKVGSDLAKLAV
jgi:hypothetical protein